MRFRPIDQSLLLAFVATLLCAPGALAQRPDRQRSAASQASAPSQALAPSQSSFGAGWLMVTEVSGGAPLFANERAQLLHAIYGWASAHGAQLMPADTYARLPANRCAASSIEKAPLEAIYPQVGEIGVSASCQTAKCELSVWVTDAKRDRPRNSWQAEVSIDQAHEIALWLDAVANLKQVPSNEGGELTESLTRGADEDRRLAISDVAAYGVSKPVYEEDFDALEQALQSCYAPKASSLAPGESILLATVQGGQISGCEADVDLSLDRTGARASCFCRVARSTPLPAQLSTTGRSRVRVEVDNRASPSGPSITLTQERSSPNFVHSVDSSFSHFVGTMQACFAQHPVALPDERQLRVTIHGSGHLQSAHLTGGGANPQLTQCLTSAIRAASFPCTDDDREGLFEATLRTSRRAVSTPMPATSTPSTSQDAESRPNLPPAPGRDSAVPLPQDSSAPGPGAPALSEPWPAVNRSR